MKTTNITSNKYEKLTVSSLPTNPTADINAGGYGYTPTQMKAAFDKLPLFIIERLNMLIDDITAEPSESISSAMLTGIAEGHTLFKLFSDIKDGTAAGYFAVGTESLATALASIKERLTRLEGEVL